MAITPAPGWKIDPNNPNGVIPDTATYVPPQSSGTYGATNTNPTAGNAAVTRTSTTPTPSAPPPAPVSFTPTQTALYNAAASQAPANNPPIQYTTNTAQNAAINSNLGFTSAANGAVANTNVSPTVSNTDISRTNLIQNQANTAQANPLSDSNNPLVANLKSSQDALAKYKQQLATTFGQMETGDEALPTVLGREGALQKQQAGYLDSLQTAVNTAQTALGQAVAAYNAQTGAQNAVTSQTQPGNNTQQVGPGNVVLNANNQPVASTPTLAPIGSQQYYSPIPNPTSGGTLTAGQTAPHIIRSGDTLYDIAAQNGTTVAALEAANPGVDPQNLQIGASLNLPAAQGSPFTAGVVSGQQQAGQNIVVMQTALGAARSIQSQINDVLKQNPSLNSSSLAAANAIQQWANGKVAPNSPYVNLLADLQEYANTIAPVLGIGGNVTDLKTGIANQLVPTLASGGTISDALDNLDTLAVGKINKIIETSKTAGSPAQTQAPSNIASGLKIGPTGSVIQTSVGPVNTNW